MADGGTHMRTPRRIGMDSTNTQSTASKIARIRDVLVNVENFVVSAICETCGETTQLDWLALALSHSEEKSLRSLARSIRCKICGTRGCSWQIATTALPAGSDAIQFTAVDRTT